jgi:PAS domain S-box-containing protein
MLKNIKISTKITILIVIISFITILAIALFTYHLNVNSRKEKLEANLSVIADNRASQLNHFFDHITSTTHFFQNSVAFKNLLNNSPDSVQKTLSATASDYSIHQLFITDLHGAILVSSDKNLKGHFADPDGSFYSNAAAGVYFSTIKRDTLAKGIEGYKMYVGSPIGNKLLIFTVDLNPIYKSLQDPNGLGETGEAFIGMQDMVTKKIILASPLRNDPGAFFKFFSDDAKEVKEIKLALEGKNGFSTGRDYRHKEVFAAYRKVTNSPWAVIVKIDSDEINGQGNQLIRIYLFGGIAILFLAMATSALFARSLTQPLNSMTDTLDLVSKGILPDKIEAASSDEFGQMATKVDGLVQTLKGSAQFARLVGEGKFNAEYKPASENDTLGLSLLNMRENLIENERRDKERNWIVRGVADVAEILRMHDTLDALGDDVLQFIIEKIGAIQGAFYIVNDEGREKLIEITASFAYNRKKYLKKSFRFAEGLVGQAAAEKDFILRTEIPDEYVTLTSGILGDQKPHCILIVPLITNEEVYGVVEFAGLKKFDSSQVKFVQELSVILARTIFNIKVNERTRRLLTESQTLSAELTEKQEVLRQNAEEMRATQEELQRSNIKLEEQIEEVNRTQNRMQLLLENASEVITIYEEDGKIRYISPSVETILGYNQKELQGQSDLDRVHPTSQEVAQGLFDQLRAKPNEKLTVQFEYKTKDGRYIWLEATGTNFMSNPAIHGFILNSRDITERRLAEQEQRMRSKMQALSENSLDIITRLEQGSISYINPTIESYTGKSPERFINKKIKEAELETGILDQWLSIVEQVNNTNDKISTEMDFPSEMGNRVMQVNAIPEYDDLENIESVLLVSHDITERKEIELEIQNKNKKINDSINYAKRIQNAILPNTRLINKALPDSFILYKPRDVVSGDFPWFVQIKNELFIAAVDCTGHGVPGALLSLIGYFLLNDIVRSRKITEPGKILDLLDEGVTQTLRQDQEDSATKDGMDIALCRINTDTRTVEYAGAHRPLYIMKGGVMEEIKGNKFPIGGGIFKNQTNFTSTKVELAKGDSFYFSSDGFPDQFGGPEVRKFGPRKIREIIEREHKNTMKEAAMVFDQEWEGWKGDQKQTDDVLLIGIKL